MDSTYNLFCIHGVFYTHIDIYHYSATDLNYIFLSNLHLHLHDISFVKISDSIFPVIILKTCIFKFSVSLGIHTS